MIIYLEDRKNDITAFKKAIKLCKEDIKTVKVLQKYLQRIEDEYRYADYLKENFIPLIKNNEEFYCAFIFYADGGDYNIEVYIKDANEISKNKYIDIYNKYCNDNQDEFFYFHVYDIEKDKSIYDESQDYDKLVIK
jgi:hypothetical protein